MATMTFYPDKHPESTSVDGRAERWLADPGEDWADIKGGVGTAAADYEDTIPIQLGGAWEAAPDQFVGLSRGFIFFDTSSLPDNANIESAILSVFGNAKFDDSGALLDINVYGYTGDNNNALEPADFVKVGSTPFSTTISYGDFNDWGWNDFALNSTGMAAITKLGTTKFVLRIPTYDVGSNIPAWSTCCVDGFTIYSADSVVYEAYKPKLVVNYSLQILKRWNGAAWVNAKTMVRSGGTWKSQPIKRWTGTGWSDVDGLG